MRLSTLAALLTVAAALVLVAPAAATTNLAPNPGFEIDCGGIPSTPCDWSGIGASRDTTIFHSGEAGLRLSALENGIGGGVLSSCIMGLSGGAYDASFWHLSPTATRVNMQVLFYAGPACDGGLSTSPSPDAPSSTSWQQFTHTFIAPAGTQSAELDIIALCSGNCPSPFDAVLDDFVFAKQQPTAVAVKAFRASVSRGGVTLSWRTSSEVETLGFHVYRQVGDWRVRLTRSLLRSRFSGTARGHTYSFLDRNARRGAVRYWLQHVGTNGTRRWFGPTQA